MNWRQALLILTILFNGCVKTGKMDNFKYVKTSEGIEEYTLTKNNLSVLLMEDHSAPVVTFMVTYKVGSRNEAVGHTGSTHLLEHLMFKGSKEFNKENNNPIWTVLQDVGAQINATTWMDRTNYFELLPSEHLETAMKIESDRMRNALLRDKDRQPEMTVVRNEFERGENDPFEALDKNIWATAYQAHPYHHSTIGWRSDIENVSTERLREFYNTFYWPNNATVSVIGDFDKESALKMIDKHFGRHTKSPHDIPVMYTEEPEQEGPRRVVVKRAGEAPIVGIAHKSPEGVNEDTYSLQILAKILGDGKTSRFYKSLVDKGLATSLYMWDYPFKDNGLFITYVFLTPGNDPDEIERIVLDEYEMIKRDGVTKGEVSRAKAKIKAETAFSRDGSYSIASNLNEAIAIGDWTFYTTFLENIENVTTEKVQEVAKKYLVEDLSTTGHFIPKKESSNGKGQNESGNPNKPNKWRNMDSSNGAGRNAFSELMAKPMGISESKIAELVNKDMAIRGIAVYSLKTGIEDVVNIRGSILGGDIYSGEENKSIAEMTSTMLDQGTTKQSKFEISEALEEVGASISFGSANYRVRFNASCLTKDVDLVIRMLAEQLRYPLFDESDLETAKKRKIGNLKRQMEDTRTRAFEAFLCKLYPSDHPNYIVPLADQIKYVEAVTTDELKQFHSENYGIGSMIIIAVGDIEREIFLNSVQEYFKDWKESPLSIELDSGVSAIEYKNSHGEVVFIKDKTSIDLIMGQPIGIDRNHEDYYPLFIGQFILGGNFSARLMQTVRDEEGLTYGIGARISGVDNGNDGFWYINGTFAPELLEKGKKSTLKELKKWQTGGVTEQELNAKKETITGSYKVRLATTRGLAGTILTNAEAGRDVHFIDDYPEIIKAIGLESVNKAIMKYCNPERLVTISAGTISE